MTADSREASNRLAFTLREAANALGLSERTVWNLIQRGELRAVKLGRTIRIPREALDELLRGAS